MAVTFGLPSVPACRRIATRISKAIAIAAASATTVACVGACVGPAPRSYTFAAAVAPRAPDFAVTLADARAARDRAFALRPPPATDFEGASDAAIDELLRQWASSRRDATQDAHGAYAEALAAAREPSEEALVHGELAALWLRLQEDTQSALLAATPTEYRSEASFVSSLQTATADALRPIHDRVATNLEECRRILGPAPAGGAATATCAAVAQRLAEVDDPSGPGTAWGARAATLRPILPTTRPKPCTFKGTLVTRGTVYAQETGAAVVLSLDSSAPIEVEALDISDHAGGRYKITVSWPKPAQGYLDAEEAPLVLMRRVELVPDAVWASPGERVTASDARGPTVRATRAFGDPLTPESSRKPAPDTLDRRLFCHDLELATARPARARLTPDDAKRGERARLRTDSVVPLLAEPSGPPVAGIVAEDVRLLERRGAFAHVTGNAPFEFDGWVEASFLRPDGEARLPR